ncbi:unnamed protein product [Urochloa humidicola]
MDGNYDDGEVAWRFGAVKPELVAADAQIRMRALVGRIYGCLDKSDTKPVVPLASGDPTPFACFRTAAAAEEAVTAAVASGRHNGYPSATGITEACSAVAAYLSRYLPYELSTGDVVLTAGCNHGIEIMMAVYTIQHLAKIAETARKLGIMVISDEVYEHFVFGSKTFVAMGVFGEITPVVTLGGISKRWMVPGWKLGWIAMTDPKGVLRKQKIFDSIVIYRGISVDPAAIVQAAIPQIIANTDETFFANAMNVMRETAEICYQKLNGIEGVTCPHKPEGSMFVMVKLDMSCFHGIDDDIDFCCKLSKEESVVISPGSGLEMKNWLRITFAVDPRLLEDGLERLRSFCLRHAKPIMNHAS